ncbi:MAG: MYG1 family protein [Chlamydiia bacterium]
MSDAERIPRSLGTHNGPFHADEVTACALLVMTGRVEPDRIRRTRDPLVLAQCEYVADVGGILDPADKRFDHHQAGYSGEQASAGLVLQYLGKEGAFSPNLVDCLRDALIWGVDATDTGRLHPQVGVCNFSQVIANFNPVQYHAPEAEQEVAFQQALQFVLGHLQRLVGRWEASQASVQAVAAAMEPQERVLMFDHALPWQDAFFQLGGEHHPAQFVIMPVDGQWKLRAIPPNGHERMKVRMPLPAAWAGLLEEDLERVSGVKGAVFCHKGRFISVWKSREAAWKALQCVLGSSATSSS